MATIRKAVIPAAGLGKRFLPITKSVPKEMLPIVDRPALQYIAEEAVSSGITELLIIVNTAKDAVIKYFSPSDITDATRGDKRLSAVDELLAKAKISFTYQERQEGNGAAVALAEEFVQGEPFAVLFGDDVIHTSGTTVTGQLMKAFEETCKTIVGTQVRPPEEAIKYGVIKKGIDLGGRMTEVLAIAEKPRLEDLPSNQCSLGRFILTPDIFRTLKAAPKLNGEIYLTTAINALAAEGKVVAYDFIGNRFDLGDKLGFLEANIAYHIMSGTPKEKILELIDKI